MLLPVAGWRVRMYDLDTQNLVFDAVPAAREIAASRRKYFVRFRLEVLDGSRLVFSHVFDAAQKHVWVTIGSGALGDAIAWVPAIDAFRQRHGCSVTVQMRPWLHALFEAGYPALRFVSEMPEISGAAHDDGEPIYATYRVGCFSPYADRDHQPTDRAGQRAVLARVGGGGARRADQRLFASESRVPYAVARDQFSRLQ